MAVTMRDVAARAGVTPTVVSKVLHQRASTVRVSEATAERVREAARELNYRLNIFARQFREQQTCMIGVLHGLGFARPMFSHGSRYFAALMDGLVNGAFEEGYSVTLCPKLFGDTPEEAMSDGRFDGLVWYSTAPSDENHRRLEDCRVPLVLIHTPASEFGDRFPSVMCDNEQGLRLALDHLFSLGHRRIAFAMQVDGAFGEAVLRRKAFLDQLSARGLLKEGSIIDVGPKEDGVSAYLEAPYHTAIIAQHDELAAAFIRVAQSKGLDVPRDLSIVGFDSTQFCDSVRPRLTSVRQPLEDIGRMAIERLIKLVRGDVLEPATQMLPCVLDLRESTAPPRG